MTRRHVEVDVVKALAILAVPLIHALRPPWDPAASGAELWLDDLLRFAVPGFLAASGFLAAGSDQGKWSDLARRLRRILFPYLVVSVLARLLAPTLTGVAAERSFWEDLLFAAAFGPYYYVFVITTFALLTPLIARLRGSDLMVVWVVCAVAQLAIELGFTFGSSVFWLLRNPLLWAAYFLAGWLARLNYSDWKAWIEPRRSILASALGVAIIGAAGLLTLSLSPAVHGFVVWLCIWLILSQLFVISCGRTTETRWLAAISDRSYTVYLYHLFFVLPLTRVLAAPPGEFSGLLLGSCWAAGLVAPLAISATARSLLGDRARDWIGG